MKTKRLLSSFSLALTIAIGLSGCVLVPVGGYIPGPPPPRPVVIVPAPPPVIYGYGGYYRHW